MIYTVNGKDVGSVNLWPRNKLSLGFIRYIMYSLANLFGADFVARARVAKRKKKNLFAPSRSPRYYQEY